jgi:hypothetical protein
MGQLDWVLIVGFVAAIPGGYCLSQLLKSDDMKAFDREEQERKRELKALRLEDREREQRRDE